MNPKDVCNQICTTGIIPSIRVPSAEDALFAARAVFQGGIPVAEVAATVPGALRVISELTRTEPGAIVGAGSVLDEETARECVAAGAKFLMTDGLIPEVVKYANKNDVVAIPGALTPTEIIAAWRAGADFVKVVPVAAAGGENYIKALKAPLSHVPLIAAGGVNQQTAEGYLAAGATALGIGQALLPWEAVALRQSNRIRELARRFLNFVGTSRPEVPRPQIQIARRSEQLAEVCQPL